MMNSLEMLPEVVCSRPLFVLGPAICDSALVGLSLGLSFRMATSRVPVNIIQGTEAFLTRTTGDCAVIGLRMLLIVFP